MNLGKAFQHKERITIVIGAIYATITAIAACGCAERNQDPSEKISQESTCSFERNRELQGVYQEIANRYVTQNPTDLSEALDIARRHRANTGIETCVCLEDYLNFINDIDITKDIIHDLLDNKANEYAKMPPEQRRNHSARKFYYDHLHGLVKEIVDGRKDIITNQWAEYLEYESVLAWTGKTSHLDTELKGRLDRILKGRE